jgi:hypothetical protein
MISYDIPLDKLKELSFV